MQITVTVITITRGRINLLQRAIRSVREQDWREGLLNHLIIADDCSETADWLSKTIGADACISWELNRRQPRESSGPSRLARIRNRAVVLAPAGWIAFLDDDNEFEENHIRTLLECAAATGHPAVHSYRKLFHFDGRPYLEELWPWCRQKSEARKVYWQRAHEGVISPGSNILRERIVPRRGRQETAHIDMNVWLLRRDILLQCAISDQFTDHDWICNRTEDDKLLEALMLARIPIGMTRVPSVRYYLGGYSNNFDGSYRHSETWERACRTSLQDHFYRSCM